MVHEFEGKTEKEAIDRAVEELNLDREKFDVEIVETEKGGIFKRGSVRIRVHLHSEAVPASGRLTAKDQVEESIILYLKELLEKMGFPGDVVISFREERKLGLEIVSPHTSILIGRKGKNLDAIQLILNIYAGRLGSDLRVVLDTENYRVRREENLVRMARKTAEQVKRSKASRLLEPMNPFERRLVHTALNEMEDIDTKSEGEGLYKQVRIIYRGDTYRH